MHEILFRWWKIQNTELLLSDTIMWSIFSLEFGMEILPHGATTEVLQFIVKCIQLYCYLRKRKKNKKERLDF